MSLPTPTTQALSDTIVAQLEGSLAQDLPLLPKAALRVLAKVLAGVVVLLYKYVGFSFLQMFVQYASWNETEVNGKKIRPLVEWGRMLGVGDPHDSQRAELTIEMDVLNQVGTLAAAAQLVKPTTNVIYTSLAPVVLDAATKQVVIRAVSDPSGNGGAGVIGNLEEDDVLEFARAQGNIAQEVRVVSIDVVGVDGETEAAYRARVLRRKQRPPQGGAYADYRIWGEEVPGVANIYPYTGDPGEVDVYVECISDLDPDGIASNDLQLAVYLSIQQNESGLATRRNVNAAVNMFPITRAGFALVLTGMDVADVPAAQTALTEGLDEYLRTREPFIVGLSVQPRRDRITQGGCAGVVHEIVSAAGGSVNDVALYKDGNLITSYTLSDGERAKLAVDGITYE